MDATVLIVEDSPSVRRLIEVSVRPLGVKVIAAEDGIRAGGIGMSIADQIGAIAPGVPVEVLGLPTRFIPHGEQKQLLAQFGLDAAGIAASARAVMA